MPVIAVVYGLPEDRFPTLGCKSPGDMRASLRVCGQRDRCEVAESHCAR
jgi:hypothetical protein